MSDKEILVTGRPALYKEELAQEICRRVANGESVTKICSEDGMPCRATVWDWKYSHPGFLNQYEAAIKKHGQCIVDSMDEIEELVIQGMIEPAAARVIMDARKWKASKFYPKMYGDKQIIESKNENLNVNIDLPLTDNDRAIAERLGFKLD